ncbi:MAG: type II secretion system F family protein [Salinirussus sp.]
MALVDLVPLVLVPVALIAWLGPRVNDRIGRIVTRLARLLFAGYVSGTREQKRIIEAAYIDTTVQTYAAKTYFYVLTAFVGGGVAGLYVVAGVLFVLESFVGLFALLPSNIADPLGLSTEFELVLADPVYWALLLGGGLVTGFGLAGLSYFFRWQLPQDVADSRKRSLRLELPRTTALMYALTRGGMTIPETLNILARNEEVYGESAREARIAVREMELFNRDMVSAVRRMSERSPSEQFKTFSQNLASVLQSGSNVSEFLHEQYEQYQQEAEDRQNEILEFLQTIAEGYVTVFVAGVLFLITVLLVFGVTTADTLPILQIIIYVLLPVSNAAFAAYLASQLSSLGVGSATGTGALDRMDVETPVQDAPDAETTLADGGSLRSREIRKQLRRYDRIGEIKRSIGEPLRTIFLNPFSVLYVTLPIAVAALVVRAPQALTGVGINVRMLDDFVIQSMLFVLITYGVVRTLYKRRLERIQESLPDFVERLASLNDSGMTIVSGIGRLRGTDLGPLTPEVERIWTDMQLGSNVDDAFVRFGRRIKATAVTRVVVLVTNAMQSSGSLGAVLRIAAGQAQSELRLRQRRRQQMFSYLIVIYLAFGVFLVIIAAITMVLIPSLPGNVGTSASGSGALSLGGSQFGRFGQVDLAAYELVFFHTAAVQALFSGFIAGQFGNGSLRDGAKHAAAMLAVAYLAFVLITGPVAGFGDSVASGPDGDQLVVDSASLSAGGFVVVRDEGMNSRVLGRTGYIEPGKHRSVAVPIDSLPPDKDVTVFAHRDTNNNRQYDYEPPYEPNRNQIDGLYRTLSKRETPGDEFDVVEGGSELVDTEAPKIASASVAPDNSYVDLRFSEPVSSNESFERPLELKNVVLSVRNNSGTVTDASAVSISAPNGSALSGTTTAVRVELALEGTPAAGSEQLSIGIRNAYDVVGNEVKGGASVELNDFRPPTLGSATRIDDTTIGLAVRDVGTGVRTEGVSASAVSVSPGTVESVRPLSVGDNGTTFAVALRRPVDADEVTLSVAGDGFTDGANNVLRDGTVTATGMDGVPPALERATGIEKTVINVTITDGVGIDTGSLTRDDFDLAAVKTHSAGGPIPGGARSIPELESITVPEREVPEVAEGGVDRRLFRSAARAPEELTVTLDLVSPVDTQGVRVTMLGDGVADISGNRLQFAGITAPGMDGVAPPKPPIAAAPVPGGGVNVSVGDVDDASNVTYTVRRFGPIDSTISDIETVGTVTDLAGVDSVDSYTVTDTTATSGRTYEYFVRVSDGSQANQSARVVATPDANGPEIDVVNVTTSGTGATAAEGDTIRVEASVSDATSGVDERRVTLDASAFGQSESMPFDTRVRGRYVWEFTVEGAPEGDGRKTPAVRAADVVGNVNSATGGAVTLDTRPPDPPANVTAAPTGAGSVGITFADVDEPGTGVTSYSIARASTAGGPYTQVGRVDDIDPADGEYTFTDSPPGGGTYYYVVRAIDAMGRQSDASEPVSASVDR